MKKVLLLICLSVFLLGGKEKEPNPDCVIEKLLDFCVYRCSMLRAAFTGEVIVNFEDKSINCNCMLPSPDMDRDVPKYSSSF